MNVQDSKRQPVLPAAGGYALTQLQALQDQLTSINGAMKTTLPWQEYQRHKAKRDAVAVTFCSLQGEVEKLRELMQIANEKSWTIVFYHCANQMLSEPMRQSIENETCRIMGREMPQQKSEVERQNDRDKSHRKRRRQRARVGYDAGRQYVWSDERGGDLREQYGRRLTQQSKHQ